ncbi:hypothetical protein Trydic_g13792 [Trypoxylus dichotomus]
MGLSESELREDFNASISALTAANGSQQQQSRSMSDCEDVIQEVMDRQSRKNNIITFGVAEQPSNLSTNQRSERERAAVAGILSASDPSTQPNGYKLYRLGHFNLSSVRPRLIKLIMSSEADAHNVIRHSKNLKKRLEFAYIRLSYDRTPRQLKVYKRLKLEQNERLAKGENNLRIRYVNGTPKICPLN